MQIAEKKTTKNSSDKTNKCLFYGRDNVNFPDNDDIWSIVRKQKA